jgi:iron complex transport system substrate-binding protein
MKLHLLIFSFALLVLTTGCNSSASKQTQKASTSSLSVRYARGFSIRYFEHYKEVTVRNPWDTTRILEKYILVNRNEELPTNLPEGTVVRVPVEKVAVCTAVHAGIWKQIGEISKVKAVCEPNYIELSEIKEGVAKGTIVDLGLATAIDLEKLIAVSPTILIVSPFERSGFGRLEKTGVPVVQDASYMEDSPLGRAEWIKFEAAFSGKEALAETIFSKIEKRYNSLCKLVSTTKIRPTVFTEMKYGQVWYVPGGNSYMGQFLKDAGANYLWSDHKQAGSIPLSFESVYDKAEKADFWLIKYNNKQSDITYQQLKTDYEPYSNFDAFKKRHIFTVNSGKTAYYDNGPMEPDVILADLVSIFHPELLKNYQFVYYREMK